MSKEERLKSRVENLDNNRLKEQVKIVNEIGVVDKIRLVGIKKLDMANAFTLAVEAIAEKKSEEDIPDTCSDLYNDLHTDEESSLDAEPKKDKPTTKATGKGGGKGGEKKKTGPPKQPVDEYGTREGTLAHTFVQEVKKKPQSMEDVRKQDWNPRGYHFNDTLRRLEAEKQATVDKDGVITIK
jgi:hypothetical protein